MEINRITQLSVVFFGLTFLVGQLILIKWVVQESINLYPPGGFDNTIRNLFRILGLISINLIIIHETLHGIDRINDRVIKILHFFFIVLVLLVSH